MVKYGKLGREFASNEYPFKKPLIMLKAGSSFYINGYKEVYGRMIENVSVREEPILHYGLAFSLPVNL